MSTYKVLQDIEAEDKLIGPLTLRQFIYAGVAAINGYLTYFVISKGVSFMAAVFIPIALICIFFAWPWSRDQPTEIWALARIRFLVKPRIRIWNQSGVRELVTITAPKKIEHILTNGLNEDEVRSRLKALSDTIDSRGWAVKNVNVNMYNQAAAAVAPVASDRLVSGASLPQPITTNEVDVQAADDILDVQNNPVAHQFDTMINASAKAHRQQIMERMQQATAPVAPPPQPQQLQTQQQNNYWFLNQPAQQGASVPQDTVTFNTQVVAPGTSVTDLPVAAAAPTPAEEDFIKHLKNEPAFSPNMHGHLHVIQPLSEQKAAAAQAQTAQPQAAQPPVANPVQQPPQNQPVPKVTQVPDAAILDLARNDDLNVATIAREAHKRKEPPEDEVVISLH
jgi:hypothetical protein